MSHDAHYDREVVHHEPKEGFDPTEPAAGKITFFVVISIITLVVVIVAIQVYLQSITEQSVEQKVLNVAPPALGEQRALEDWRMTHYEYNSPAKTGVRLPLDRARALVLEDAAAGRTFYPAKASTPVPEQPAAAPAAGGAPAGEAK